MARAGKTSKLGFALHPNHWRFAKETSDTQAEPRAIRCNKNTTVGLGMSFWLEGTDRPVDS